MDNLFFFHLHFHSNMKADAFCLWVRASADIQPAGTRARLFSCVVSTAPELISIGHFDFKAH